MPMTALGRSDLQVSRLALGSWRTYERISRDQGVRVMRAAREAGINFLDDARYNDETGHAPLPTGYSEVVFGELFRASGWRRDEAVVSNKLWWEFWPDQSPAQELAGSLGRMGLEHIDLIYSEVPPDGVGLEDAVDMITEALADVCGHVRKRVEHTEELDPVTQDLLIGVLATLEKHHWMFAAQKVPSERA